MSDLAIVGGAGEMGEWLVEVLKEDFDVTIFDVDVEGAREVAAEFDVGFAESRKVLEEMDVVVLSVPTDVVEEAIRDCSGYVRSGSWFLDVTSLKEKPIMAMKEHLDEEVRCVGCHPLFGPSEEPGFGGKNLVLSPVNDSMALERVKQYLEGKGACVRVMSGERHDEAMAFVQALTHLVSASFGQTLGEAGVDFSGLETPAFGNLLDNLERIGSQDPELYVSIQRNNRFAKEVFEKYRHNLDRLVDSLDEGDGFFRDVLEGLG